MRAGHSADGKATGRRLRELAHWISAVVLAAAASGCAGSEFASGDGGTGTSGAGNVGSAGTPPIDACGAVTCDVLDCAPGLQVRAPGECCAHCPQARACTEGVRCDGLTCPGDKLELAEPGCCVCAGVSCEGTGVACTDAECLGTDKTELADSPGCCECGALLECPAGQSACDTLLCNTSPIYRGDGCCVCEEAVTCDQDAFLCDSTTTCGADQLKKQVSADCCQCDDLLKCEGDTQSCDTLTCQTGTLVAVTADCCACEEPQPEPTCGGELFLCDDPTMAACDYGLETVDSACCRCADGPDPSCPGGSFVCGADDCAEGELPQEVGDGCCVCEPGSATICDAPAYVCGAQTCDTEEADQGDGCCVCAEPEVCGADVQSDYSAARDELIDKENARECTVHEDCVVAQIANRCRVECAVALRKDRVDAVQEALESYGEANCDACPDVDRSCTDEAPSVPCMKGVCTLLVQN